MKTYNIADFKGDFGAAFSALQKEGGGVLRVGAGLWNSLPIKLPSRTELILEKGAVLSFIPEPALYRPVLTRWEGLVCYAHAPCVFADGESDIAITGEGTIEGNGEAWWNMLWDKKKRGQTKPETELEKELASLNPRTLDYEGGGGGRATQFLRPPLIQFHKCENIKLEGITVKNSPFWTIHPVFCKGLVIKGLFIRNPHDAPNTDGIDIDSSEDVLIENCDIDVGDDGIALKSGAGEDGVKAGRPTRGVKVQNCVVRGAHGGIVVGSETAGGVEDAYVHDCRFFGTDRGIRIKTRRGRGGLVQNLLFENIEIENALCPFVINMYYRCGTTLESGCFSLEKQPITSETPEIRGITLRNVSAKNCRASAGFVAGLPERPVRGLVLRNCNFQTNKDDPTPPSESDMYLGLPETDSKEFRVLNAEMPVFDNCKFE